MPDIGPCPCHGCVKQRVTYGTRTYDENGYDPDGYDRDARDIDGRDIDGDDREGVNALGFDRDGNPKNVDSSDLNLIELWEAFTTYGPNTRRGDFLEHLRDITRDVDSIDYVTFCDVCGEPQWADDDMSSAGTDAQLCRNCWDTYKACDNCDRRFPADNLNST